MNEVYLIAGNVALKGYNKSIVPFSFFMRREEHNKDWNKTQFLKVAEQLMNLFVVDVSFQIISVDKDITADKTQESSTIH